MTEPVPTTTTAAATMEDTTAMASTSPVASVKEGDIVSVQNLNMAGIGHTNDERLLYCRAGVVQLLELAGRVVQVGVLGLVYGLPGTGKSCTLWYKMQCLAETKKRIAWFHFDRNGLNDARVFLDENGCRNENTVKKKDLENAIEAATADILVLDGVNRDNYTDALEQLVFWRKAGTNRAGFLTVSNKTEELHPHELENMKEKGLHIYFTQHSWTLDEYLAAFVNEDESASPIFQDNVDVFKKEWEITRDTQAARKRDRTGSLKLASITEIVTQKYFFVGGSACWVVRFTTSETENEIGRSIAEAKGVGDILDINLGPKSPVAKTNLYGSKEDKDGITRYSIVSERATQMLVDVYGANGIKELYAHATKINNPAFLGWVIEADFFSRCERDNMFLCKKGNPSADAITRNRLNNLTVTSCWD